jgi:hypothetical protein
LSRFARLGLELVGLELELVGLELVGLELVGLELVRLELVGLELVRLELVGLELVGLELVDVVLTEEYPKLHPLYHPDHEISNRTHYRIDPSLALDELELQMATLTHLRLHVQSHLVFQLLI